MKSAFFDIIIVSEILIITHTILITLTLMIIVVYSFCYFIEKLNNLLWLFTL